MRRPNLSCKTNFSGANGDKGFFPCSANPVNRIGNLPVKLYSASCDDITYIHIYCCSGYSQLPPVIGAPWGYCGRGFLFPVGYDRWVFASVCFKHDI